MIALQQNETINQINRCDKSINPWNTDISLLYYVKITSQMDGEILR